MEIVHTTVLILYLLCIPMCANTQNSTASEPVQSGLLTLDPFESVLVTSSITNTDLVTMETRSVQLLTETVVQTNLLTIQESNTTPVVLQSSSTMSVSIATSHFQTSVKDSFHQTVSRGTVEEESAKVFKEEVISIVTGTIGLFSTMDLAVSSFKDEFTESSSFYDTHATEMVHSGASGGQQTTVSQTLLQSPYVQQVQPSQTMPAAEETVTTSQPMMSSVITSQISLMSSAHVTSDISPTISSSSSNYNTPTQITEGLDMFTNSVLTSSLTVSQESVLMPSSGVLPSVLGTEGSSETIIKSQLALDSTSVRLVTTYTLSSDQSVLMPLDGSSILGSSTTIDIVSVSPVSSPSVSTYVGASSQSQSVTSGIVTSPLTSDHVTLVSATPVMSLPPDSELSSITVSRVIDPTSTPTTPAQSSLLVTATNIDSIVVSSVPMSSVIDPTSTPTTPAQPSLLVTATNKDSAVVYNSEVSSDVVSPVSISETGSHVLVTQLQASETPSMMTGGVTLTALDVSTQLSETGTSFSTSVEYLAISSTKSSSANSITPNISLVDLTATESAVFVDITPTASGLDVTQSASVLDLTPTASGLDVTPSMSGLDITPSVSVLDVTLSMSGLDLTPTASGLDITPSMSGLDVTLSVSGLDITPTASGLDITPSMSGLDVTLSVSGLDITPTASGLDITPSMSGLDITSSMSGLDLTPTVSVLVVTSSLSSVDVSPNVSVVYITPTVSAVSTVSAMSTVSSVSTVSGLDLTSSVDFAGTASDTIAFMESNASSIDMSGISSIYNFSALVMTDSVLTTSPLNSDIQISEVNATASYEVTATGQYGDSTQSLQLTITPILSPSSVNLEMTNGIITDVTTVYTGQTMVSSILQPSVTSSPVLLSQNDTGLTDSSFRDVNVSTAVMTSMMPEETNYSTTELYIAATPSLTQMSDMSSGLVMSGSMEVAESSASGNRSSEVSIQVTNMTTTTNSVEMSKSVVTVISPSMSSGQEMLTSMYNNINTSDSVVPWVSTILPTIATTNTSDAVQALSTMVPIATHSLFASESLMPSLPDFTLSMNMSGVTMETSSVYFENSTTHVFNHSASSPASELFNASDVGPVSEISLTTITKPSPTLDITTAPSVFPPSEPINSSSVVVVSTHSTFTDNMSLSLLPSEMSVSSLLDNNTATLNQTEIMTAPFSESPVMSTALSMTSQSASEQFTISKNLTAESSLELTSLSVNSLLATDTGQSQSTYSSQYVEMTINASSMMDIATVDTTLSMELTTYPSISSTAAHTSTITSSVYSTDNIVDSLQPSQSVSAVSSMTPNITSEISQVLSVSIISSETSVVPSTPSQQIMTSTVSSVDSSIRVPGIMSTVTLFPSGSSMITAPTSDITQNATSAVVIQTSTASILSLVTLNISSQEMSSYINVTSTEEPAMTSFVMNVSEVSPTSTVAMTTVNETITVKPTADFNISEVSSVEPSSTVSMTTSNETSSPVVTTSALPPTTTQTTTTPLPTTTTTTLAPTTTSSFVVSYWIRTELKVPLSENVTADTFLTKMEGNLARAYNLGFERQEQIAQGNYQPLKKRKKRATEVDGTAVDIRDASRSAGDVTLGYVVQKNGTYVLASEVVTTIGLLSDQEMAILLGYVVTDKASSYVQQTTVSIPPEDTSNNLWIVGVAVGGIVLIIAVIWLIFCLVVKKKRSEGEVDEKGGQPHLVRMKGPRGEENESNASEVGESSAGLKVRSTKKQSYEVTPENGRQYENPVYAEVNKRGKRSPVKDTVTMETEKDGLIPSPSKKGKKKRKTKSPGDFDTLGDGQYYDTVKTVHPTSKMVPHPLPDTGPLYEEEEELQRKKEAERKKNKQRLREKRRRAKEDTGEDDTLKQYLAAQEEIDAVLDAPPDDEKVQEVFKNKSKKGSKKKKHSKKKKSEGNTNEAFDDEPLVEAKKRMHKLLDDAFALISPAGSVEGLTDEGNKVFPKENGVPLTNGTGPTENGHVPYMIGIESGNDTSKPEKKHEPLYLNPAYEPSAPVGLTTWSPYRAADQVALISMPKTLQTPLENDDKRAPRRPAAQLPLDTMPKLSNKYATDAPKPLILRSREMKKEQSKESGRDGTKSYLKNGFGTHGESDLDTMKSTFIGNESRKADNSPKKRGSMEMKNYNGDVTPQKSPPKHQAPSKRIKEGYDETDVVSKTIHAGQTSDNTIKAVRNELKNALGPTVLVTGKGRPPSGSLVDIA